jgi:lysophospholipase L1-like esterase
MTMQPLVIRGIVGTRLLMVLTGLVCATTACGNSLRTSSSSPSVAPGSATNQATWHVVALGDSDTTGSGDPTGVGWVGSYGRLLEQKIGLSVDVQNLAVEGKTSDGLLSDLTSDETTRAVVADAEVVLIGIGGADLNAGDSNLQAGACTGRSCYEPVLRAFGRNFAQIVAEVRELRSGAPTIIRAITLPNALPGAESVIPSFITPEISLYQAITETQIICRTMQKYGGRCVDVLHVFNGPSGVEDAYKTGLMNLQDCCYANTKGQRLIAALLIKTGLAPIGRPST